MKPFLMGAATAAHQVEGNNISSDFWVMEHMRNSSFKEKSMDAVDHYNRFKEDIDLLVESGLNAYRFSIEWARIQPEKDVWSQEAIEHYREVLNYCHEVGVEPVVTMHHFSSPKWLIDLGGWESADVVGLFAAYCEFVANELGDLMHYVCTINEANMGLQLAAVAESMLKQMQSDAQVGINAEMLRRRETQREELLSIFGTYPANTFLSIRTPKGDLLIMEAHKAARNAMKAVKPNLQVGVTLSLYDLQFKKGGEAKAQKQWVDDFLHYLPFIENDDFLGVQNYTRKIYGPNGVEAMSDKVERTQMDYEFYPQAISNVLRKVFYDLKIPLIVTENGIATLNDKRRVAFIEEALNGVKACVDDGIPVKGYFYWSLLDNFEWQKGFDLRFGLIRVDRTTQKRYPKKSLSFLGTYTNKL